MHLCAEQRAKPAGFKQQCSAPKAEIALFISLEPPTAAMVNDAASVGFYESFNGKKYPGVQLFTIEALLSGLHRAEHPDYEPDLNFKKAKAEMDA
jgi:hypothetical protein